MGLADLSHETCDVVRAVGKILNFDEVIRGNTRCSRALPSAI